jgi:hypothetical protein
VRRTLRTRCPHVFLTCSSRWNRTFCPMPPKQPGRHLRGAVRPRLANVRTWAFAEGRRQSARYHAGCPRVPRPSVKAPRVCAAGSVTVLLRTDQNAFAGSSLPVLKGGRCLPGTGTILPASAK